MISDVDGAQTRVILIENVKMKTFVGNEFFSLLLERVSRHWKKTVMSRPARQMQISLAK